MKQRMRMLVVAFWLMVASIETIATNQKGNITLETTGGSKSLGEINEYSERFTLETPQVPYALMDARLGRGPFRLTIKGIVRSTAHIGLNLADANRFPIIAVPFHLSIRPEAGMAVNYFRYNACPGHWQKEDTDLTYPDSLKVGQPIEIIILMKGDGRILASVNGEAFSRNIPDAPYINTFEIDGPADSVDSIQFEFK